MKNLKRALSLVLAMVMLVGMMVIPTNAVSNFKDEAEISYTEAVEVTSGIGLFAGSNGNFMPQGTVTRAQMATIIVKMLNGSDANADAFKGAAGGFSDTLAFEGGWAEGYINWCASLGVVAGYGDGTFKPGQAVTTAEAVTMILNALKVDAGEGQWPLTVMAKAEELKLFEDMSPKPDTNKALTREELAVIALHGLEYSPEGKSGYTVNGVTYDSYMEAYYAAGQNPANVLTGKTDSLAQKVFELNTVSGYVIRNQETGFDYTEIDNGVTTFTFDIETGLEDIGHYVTVYYAEEYKNEREPGLTYTVLDEGTVVVVEEDPAGSAAKFRAAFGTGSVKLYDELSCKVDGTYVATADDVALTITGFDAAAFKAPAGTYVMDGNTVMAYIAPVTTYASYVTLVDTFEGEETVELAGVMNAISNSADDDMVDEYAGIKKDDFVTYTVAQGRYILNKASVVSGKVTATSKDEDNRDVITMDGKDYVSFGAENNATLLETDASKANYTDTYSLYVTADGKYIGFEASGVSLDADTTVYLLGTISFKDKDAYGAQTITYKARGVNLKGNEVLIPLAQVKDANKDGEYTNGEETIGDYTVADALAVREGFYSVKNCADKDGRKVGLKTLTGFARNDRSADYYTSRYNLAGDGGSNFTGMGSYEIGQCYPNADSKFIFLEGDKDQSYPLVSLVRTGTMSMVLEPEHMATGTQPGSKAPVALLTLDSSGANVIQVLVVKTSVNATVNAEHIYVSAEGIESPARSAAGYTYTAYATDTGKERTVTLSNDATLEQPGFYSISYNEEEQAYDLVNAEQLPEDYPDGFIPSVGTNKSGEVGGDDGVNDYNTFYGADLVYIYDKYISASATGLARREHGNAVVVDVRSESEIEASKISKITSIDRMASLKSSRENLVITMDIWYNCLTDRCSVIFITGVVEPEAGPQMETFKLSDGDVIYVPEKLADTTSGEVNAYVVAGRNSFTPGKLYTMNYTVMTGTQNIYGGFWRCTVDEAEGVITLGAAQGLSTVAGPTYTGDGKYGWHQMLAVDGIGDTTIVTGNTQKEANLSASRGELPTPSEWIGKHTNAAASSPCGVCCLHNSREALYTVNFDNTLTIIDRESGEMLTLDQLKALNEANYVLVDYYCGDGTTNGSGAAIRGDDVSVIFVITTLARES